MTYRHLVVFFIIFSVSGCTTLADISPKPQKQSIRVAVKKIRSLLEPEMERLRGRNKAGILFYLSSNANPTESELKQKVLTSFGDNSLDAMGSLMDNMHDNLVVNSSDTCIFVFKTEIAAPPNSTSCESLKRIVIKQRSTLEQTRIIESKIVDILSWQIAMKAQADKISKNQNYIVQQMEDVELSTVATHDSLQDIATDIIQMANTLTEEESQHIEDLKKIEIFNSSVFQELEKLRSLVNELQ